MKKILYIFFWGTFFAAAQETNLNDIVRLSNENLTGTARFRAMGGAFGAVGGDLSALNVNPAGSLFFNNNVATASLSIFNRHNNNTYFGSVTKNSDTSISLNQIGGALVFENKNRNWNKFVFALNYDNQNTFDNFYRARGYNQNSIDEYFLRQAQGVPLGEIRNIDGFTADYQYLGETNGLGFSAQQAYLAYQSFIIEPFSNNDNENEYFTNVPTPGNFLHENVVENLGYNGKLAINFAGSYKDFINIGMNLNVHFVDISRNTALTEVNNNAPYNNGQTVRSIFFKNNLYTTGGGFSLNLGMILKPTKFLRIGLNYESPTWYRLNDELSQSVFASSNNINGTNPQNVSVAPNVINVYPEYNIRTPQKIGVSGAFILNKFGLLSFDYIRKDYTTGRISPTNDDFYASINQQAREELTSSNELRLGGEFRIKALSLRGGYRFEESPYKNNKFFGDYSAISGGLGYTFGDQRLDLAYTMEARKYGEFFLSSGFNGGAVNRFKSHNITMSYSINF